VHPPGPWNPVKVDEKADRTVVPGNISQAESQKGVLSKSTDTDKNNNNIAVPTQAPKMQWPCQQNGNGNTSVSASDAAGDFLAQLAKR